MYIAKLSIKKTQQAIKNLKFDKITVWDNNAGKDGASSTSNFASSLFKSIPPMQELFNMAGLELPKYLATKKDDEKVEDVEIIK